MIGQETTMTTQLTIDYEVAPCSLGWFAIGTTADGLCALEFSDRAEALPSRLAERFPEATLRPRQGEPSPALARVEALLRSPRSAPDLKLDLQGTPFQKTVWQALMAIPAGSTVSYSELAKRLGKPKSARAVAGACAANQVALVVPCHRVVRNDGHLGGYRWGLERKRALLQMEAAA
tara:strand:- start:517 stop:1047 length:531 start_codon:yes stop_codon:yes gene_type:complete